MRYKFILIKLRRVGGSIDTQCWRFRYSHILLIDVKTIFSWAIWLKYKKKPKNLKCIQNLEIKKPIKKITKDVSEIHL